MTRRDAEAIDPKLCELLAAGDLAEPQRLLGPHAIPDERRIRVCVHHPEAVAASLLLAEGRRVPLAPVGAAGVYAAALDAEPPAPAYRIRFEFADGSSHEQEDPYRFAAALPDAELQRFAAGTHRALWRLLGAHPLRVEGVDGVRFAVWAPHARRASVVGDFCCWDGRRLPMCRLGDSGVFALFVPGIGEGANYKFELKTSEGALRLKSDPLAFSMERPPASASRVFRSQHVWRDDAWIAQRESREPRCEPLAAYEVHLGSWRRDAGGKVSYAELAEPLIAHAQRFGFTHIELMPVAEHPFDGSWGYQVSAYYAPTARYGTPDDLRAFVDACHRAQLGVILDWVPAHFPRDDYALRRFDGRPLYEYDDPRLGEHPHWGTLVFDYVRGEVRSFLLANALYWLQEFHVDGLRVDAVASMLYRDYGRSEGEWLPNESGGRENLEAISFLRELNLAVREQCPGCFTVAEESTPWPGVTKAVEEGGLGFTFKWNLGWMHDTLDYFRRDPVHRRHHQDQLTFAMAYEYSECFLMPLSHDEVVHGKGSLLSRMPGDDWQRFANLRCLFTYQFTRPGKKLLFMGSELAPESEWDYRRSLDWALAEDPRRAALAHFLERLGALYREHPCLWKSDPSPDGFRWIDCSDRAQSVLVYLRRFFDDELVVALNLTPVPRTDYRIGVPRAGAWVARLCSDDPSFGGSGYPRRDRARAEPVAMHGQPSSLCLQLPPLSALVLARDAD